MQPDARLKKVAGMNKIISSKKGFTLVEILTAVVIVAILTVMAVPLYEKTIERSRLTEAQTVLNRLQAAKIQAMDDMECSSYSAAKVASGECPKLKHLRVQFKNECPSTSTDTSFCSKAFKYSIKPSGPYSNGVCATRLGGDYAGTTFYYLYDEFDQRADTEHEPKVSTKCYGTACEDYGFPAASGSISCENE